MDIVYAAEITSIADLLGDHVKRNVRPQELSVTENPDETGSFLIDWRLGRYVLSPGGEIASDGSSSSSIPGPGRQAREGSN